MMRTMQMDEGLGRAVGCLVGAAVGDALGAPFEFGPAGQWSERFPEPVLDGSAEMIGGGAFGWAPGQFTDDTEMATIVAESLLACGEIDVVDQFERFRAWAAKANDVGNTTRSVLDSGLHPDDAAAEIVRRSGGRGTAGNGSLMRVAAGAIRFAPLGTGETVDAAKRLSAVTHADPLCVWAVAVAHEMVRVALRGDDPLEAIGHVMVWMPREVHDVYSPLLADDWHPGMGGPGNGSAMGALAQAVWALRTSSSYEEIVTKVIDLGGDTDSVAAVAGALAGARWGVDAIPERWRVRVHGVVNQRGGDVQTYEVDELVRLATELLEAGRRDAAERFLPDSVFEEKVANLSDAQRRELRELVDRLRGEESHAEWHGGDQVGTTPEGKPILHVPYPVYSEAVTQLMDLLYAGELVVPFDWGSWLSASGVRTAGLSDQPALADAVRFVTAIVRGERFCDGNVDAAIREGSLLRAIEAITSAV